jgi:photosystem II stability/assembly factor-like uncharacterized protein
VNAQEWFKYADFPVNIIPKDITVNDAGTLFLLTTENSIYYKTLTEDWVRMSTESILNINCISADITTNRIYVGTLNGGIFYTSDFGANWGNTFLTTNPHTGMHESYNFISNIRNSNLFFATNLNSNQLVKFVNQGTSGQVKTVNSDTGFGIYDLYYTQNQKLLVGSNMGVWISTDNGNNYSASGLSGLGIFSFTESENGNVYALSTQDSGQNKLWVSTNADYNEWTELNLPTQNNGFKILYYDQSSSMLWLADENSIYKSPDDNINWSNENHNQNNPNVVGLVEDNHGNFFSFTTENNCQSYISNAWESTNTGLRGEIHQILFDESDKLFAYNNYYSNKLSSKENISQNWIYETIGETGGIKNLIKYDANTFLLSLWNKVYKSVDGGQNFTELPLPDDFADQWAGGIGFFKKGESGDLYITHTFIPNTIYVSHDTGETWNTLNLIENAEDISQGANGNLFAILFGMNTEFLPQLFYSTDGGANWNQLENDLMGFSTDTAKLISKGEKNYIQLNGKVYEININNETLTEIPLPFTVPNNFDLGFTINDQNEFFVMDDNYNLYKSLNEGTDWENLGKPSGVPNGYITSIAFGFENTPFVIYKAYNSSSELQGVYYYGDEILSVADEPVSSNILVYPNPVSGEFYIKTDYRGNLHLFNVSGKLVQKEIVNQEVTKINIQSLPKGIYFLKLENGQSYKVLKQ